MATKPRSYSAAAAVVAVTLKTRKQMPRRPFNWGYVSRLPYPTGRSWRRNVSEVAAGRGNLLPASLQCFPPPNHLQLTAVHSVAQVIAQCVTNVTYHPDHSSLRAYGVVFLVVRDVLPLLLSFSKSSTSILNISESHHLVLARYL